MTRGVKQPELPVLWATIVISFLMFLVFVPYLYFSGAIFQEEL